MKDKSSISHAYESQVKHRYIFMLCFFTMYLTFLLCYTKFKLNTKHNLKLITLYFKVLSCIKIE